jgi:hypothetical protein
MNAGLKMQNDDEEERLAGAAFPVFNAHCGTQRGISAPGG